MYRCGYSVVWYRHTVCSFTRCSFGLRHIVSYSAYLQQAEHGVAYVEAMPPVVVGDGSVALPHCVHPSGQCLVWGGRGDCRKEKIRRADKGPLFLCPSAWGNPHHCSRSMLFFSLLILTTVCTTATMMSTLVIIFFTFSWLTSAGTLNFSTTPSSKNMRMPALMRSNSETGKSLKENKYRLSPLTSSAFGQVAFWRTD